MYYRKARIAYQGMYILYVFKMQVQRFEYKGQRLFI